jgi:hypothetical protein
MPFPYLVPINRKKWLVEVLEEREKNPQLTAFKMPYAVLTSGALVINTKAESDTNKRREQLKQLIKFPQNGYQGCIITNNIKINDTYQLEDTIVGYDFSGRPIKVIGEKNRRVSTPIIEEIEIDTDGANNTLKTARITIKCFTLKQLEIFELFFLKPGMPLLLEFGDGSILRHKKSRYSKPEEALVINKLNYNEFLQTFSKLSTADDTTIRNFYKKAEDSLGTYDYVAGKVTNFSYTIDDSSIYNVSLEISQANQFTLAIPHTTPKQKSNTDTPPQNLTNNQIIEQAKLQLISDFNLDIDKFNRIITNNKKDYSKEFFNVGKRAEKVEDSNISLNSYISLRFILEVLMNYSIDGNTEFEFKIPKYKINGVESDIIPVRSHKNIISSSEVIIFPGNLPNFEYKDDKSNEIIISNKPIKCFINNYSFNTDDTISTLDGKEITKQENYTIANALNCFIKYDEILQIWKKSYTRLDFLESIITLINENSYGIFELHIASQTEGGVNSIIDFKLQNKESKERDVYRFKPTTINSIVRTFNFNMELSDLMAGHTVFNAQKFIADAISKQSVSGSMNAFEENVYKSVDMSQYTTYDGWYSIDNISLQTLLSKQEPIKESIDNKISSDNSKTDDTVTNDKNKREAILTSKFVSFKETPDSTNILKLIFTDTETVKNNILKGNVVNNAVKSILTPIEISIVIDGLSGLSCGEYFHIDGIPETYNRDGAFQITNIKHNITSEGWLTTIEAGWLIIN